MMISAIKDSQHCPCCAILMKLFKYFIVILLFNIADKELKDDSTFKSLPLQPFWSNIKISTYTAQQ